MGTLVDSIAGDMPVWALLWCVLALFCGGLIKGTLGVGTPLLTVPMMAMVMPAQSAVAMMAMPVVVANLWQAWQAPRGHRVVQRQWPTALSLLLGTWVGTHILAGIDEKPLLLIVGLLVLSFTFLQYSRFQLQLAEQHERIAGLCFGAMAGLVGGLSSMFGPMMILYLMAIPNLSKDRFVGTISFLYLAAVVPWALQLYWRGLLEHPLLLLSTLGVLPVVAGMAVGQSIRTRVSEHWFRLSILVILLISGLSLLWRSVG